MHRKSAAVTRSSSAGWLSAKRKFSSYKAASRVLEMDLLCSTKKSQIASTRSCSSRAAAFIDRNNHHYNWGGANRTKWSKEEDDTLSKAVMKSMSDTAEAMMNTTRGLLADLATPDWADISSHFPKRSLKQCRDR